MWRRLKKLGRSTLLNVILLLGCTWNVSASVVFETTSAYHHIRVVDEAGIRVLSFDKSMESRMYLRNPLAGHFEYTEHFHMPWLWNTDIANVLMIGLGGATTQRAFQHYYPDVSIDTVEIDPTVVRVAKRFFLLKESPKLKVHVADGRVYLRRSKKKYGVILMDAYSSGRYGSQIPYHLATKEFFELARDHMTEEGVLAYNVIGTLQGWRADILGAVHKTLKSVFPQVYVFPSTESLNVVLIATRSTRQMSLPILQRRAAELITKRRITLSTFQKRLHAFRSESPPAARLSPILTDNYAPIDGLLRQGR